ncbi:MAG: fumarate hydratase [Candidatus Coatesbacteria bacterium]|nr:MAG: fumarate hydratase [Candidatus Coatesbacteria bacterium]
MRAIKAADISAAVKDLCIDASHNLPDDVIEVFKKFAAAEESEVAKQILEQLVENAAVAAEGEYPLCQDCGFAVFLVEQGNEVAIEGASLSAAIDEGVRQGYEEGYLRKSIVDHPVYGKNTGDNTPSVIHVFPTKGDKLVIHLAPKGGGSENMSKIAMLKPADGREGIINFVMNTVAEAGPNPCPPIVVGVGIGGTFEYCALMAKKALFRDLGKPSDDEWNAELERELLAKINDLGIGPMGYGGRTTALAVHVESFPRHIASFPASVNINCHSARHKTVEI